MILPRHLLGTVVVGEINSIQFFLQLAWHIFPARACIALALSSDLSSSTPLDLSLETVTACLLRDFGQVPQGHEA